MAASKRLSFCALCQAVNSLILVQVYSLVATDYDGHLLMPHFIGKSLTVAGIDILWAQKNSVQLNIISYSCIAVMMLTFTPPASTR